MRLEKENKSLKFLLKEGGVDENLIKQLLLAYDHGSFHVPDSYKEFPELEIQASPYYWWFEFLKLNENYQMLCESPKLAQKNKLFKDFGNIFKYVDFVEWWDDGGRGKRLFGENIAEYKNISRLNVPPSAEDLNNQEFMYLKVPLALSKRSLVSSFHTLLDYYHKGRRGHKVNYSTAQYKLTRQPSPLQLLKTFDTYELKLYSGDNYALWEIAKGLDLCPHLTDKLELTTDEKSYLSVTAFKHITRAEILIDNAGKGSFPNNTDNRDPAKRIKRMRKILQ